MLGRRSTTVAMFCIRTRNVMEHWTGVLARGVTEPAMQTVQIASPISGYFNEAFFLRGGGGRVFLYPEYILHVLNPV